MSLRTGENLFFFFGIGSFQLLLIDQTPNNRKVKMVNNFSITKVNTKTKKLIIVAIFPTIASPLRMSVIRYVVFNSSHDSS